MTNGFDASSGLTHVFDVLCSNCKKRLFRVIPGDKDKPIVCYKSNCPECGSESFYKRTNRGRVDSDYQIVDSIKNDDIITLELEKYYD